MTLQLVEQHIRGCGLYERQTASGRIVDLRHPCPTTIAIEDIAHHLSHLCRFTGATRTAYSVAQHSVLVSRMVPRDAWLWGLLHDAAEAYTGDLSSPLKRLVPQFRTVEHALIAVIRRVFGLVDDEPPAVKRADLTLLAWEARSFLPHHEWHEHIEGADYGLLKRRAPIRAMKPEAAKRAFLARYREILETSFQETKP